MLRSSTLLEHGPRLPVQRQWNTWLLLVVVAVVLEELLLVLVVVAAVEGLEVIGLGPVFQLLPVRLTRLLLVLAVHQLPPETILFFLQLLQVVGEEAEAQITQQRQLPEALVVVVVD